MPLSYVKDVLSKSCIYKWILVGKVSALDIDIESKKRGKTYFYFMSIWILLEEQRKSKSKDVPEQGSPGV